MFHGRENTRNRKLFSSDCQEEKHRSEITNISRFSSTEVFFFTLYQRRESPGKSRARSSYERFRVRRTCYFTFPREFAFPLHRHFRVYTYSRPRKAQTFSFYRLLLIRTGSEDIIFATIEKRQRGAGCGGASAPMIIYLDFFVFRAQRVKRPRMQKLSRVV